MFGVWTLDPELLTHPAPEIPMSGMGLYLARRERFVGFHPGMRGFGGEEHIVHEATRTSGFGAELSALVTERCFYHLEAPVERVTGFDTPYPHSLEWAYFPGPVRIGEAIDKLLSE